MTTENTEPLRGHGKAIRSSERLFPQSFPCPPNGGFRAFRGKPLMDLMGSRFDGVRFYHFPNRNIFKFAVSVDEVERRTGLNFFSALPDDEETRLEASFDTKPWR